MSAADILLTRHDLSAIASLASVTIQGAERTGINGTPATLTAIRLRFDRYGWTAAATNRYVCAEVSGIATTGDVNLPDGTEAVTFHLHDSDAKAIAKAVKSARLAKLWLRVVGDSTACARNSAGVPPTLSVRPEFEPQECLVLEDGRTVVNAVPGSFPPVERLFPEQWPDRPTPLGYVAADPKHLVAASRVSSPTQLAMAPRDRESAAMVLAQDSTEPLRRAFILARRWCKPASALLGDLRIVITPDAMVKL